MINEKVYEKLKEIARRGTIYFLKGERGVKKLARYWERFPKENFKITDL